MNPKFKQTVDEKDIIGVRVALSAELLQDPRGNSFDEMLKYAEASLDNLYVADDGQNEERPSAEWNQDYLFELKNKLDFNFSKEKLEMFKKVAQCVLKGKARQLDTEERETKYSRNNTENGQHNYRTSATDAYRVQDEFLYIIYKLLKQVCETLEQRLNITQEKPKRRYSRQ